MKGILFQPWKIKAIAANPDKEWQTRRIIKPQPEHFYYTKDTQFPCLPDGEQMQPRYHVGETVYIKEAHFLGGIKPTEWVTFKDSKLPIPRTKVEDYHWRSPMFMPAWAARYFIKITDVRAERLRDISPDDAVAEGINDDIAFWDDADKIQRYAKLWDSINKPPYDWASNCWVWVYSFVKVDKPEAAKHIP